MLTVPAHQYLWDSFDMTAHLIAGSSPREICVRVFERGFQMGFLCVCLGLASPLLWVSRKVNRLPAKTGTDNARLP